MNKLLATIYDADFEANLTAAITEAGGNETGGNFLRVNKHTGELTFGADNLPVPPDHQFVVGLNQASHGYLVTDTDQKVIEDGRHMIPMNKGARPMPPDGKYGTFEGGGPRNATEIVLSSVQEPGWELTLTAWSPSNNRRLIGLLARAVAHMRSDEGKAGFIHPIVKLKAGSYVKEALRHDLPHRFRHRRLAAQGRHSSAWK